MRARLGGAMIVDGRFAWAWEFVTGYSHLVYIACATPTTGFRHRQVMCHRVEVQWRNEVLVRESGRRNEASQAKRSR